MSDTPPVRARSTDRPSALVRAETPEERELIRKLLELGQFEEMLADRELALATLTAELHAFEVRFARIVGVLLAELDEIEAQIAEAQAKRHPGDAQARERARQSRRRSEASSRSAAAAATSSPRAASDALRALYREVARQIHPDLAPDDDSRVTRTTLMAQANRAYEAGDEDALRALLREWSGRPESVVGDSVAAQLVRVIRKIDRVRIRLKVIENEIAGLRDSDTYELKERVIESERRGWDLLAEIAGRVSRQIEEARARLAATSRQK